MTLRQVSYGEVAEIAHQGAKVLHPRAAEIAMRYSIPLWVRSTFSDDPGTEIVPDERAPNRRITGVTHTGKITYLAFDMPCGPDTARIELEVYRLIAQANINMHLISVNPAYLGFAVPSKSFATLRGYLDGLVIPFDDERGRRCYVLQIGLEPSRIAESQVRLLKSASSLGELIVVPVKVTENCSMVSVIGRISGKQPGIFRSVLEVLGAEGIPVFQTADSDHSLSCLVPESDTDHAVRLLHERFDSKTPDNEPEIPEVPAAPSFPEPPETHFTRPTQRLSAETPSKGMRSAGMAGSIAFLAVPPFVGRPRLPNRQPFPHLALVHNDPLHPRHHRRFHPNDPRPRKDRGRRKEGSWELGVGDWELGSGSGVLPMHGSPFLNKRRICAGEGYRWGFGSHANLCLHCLPWRLIMHRATAKVPLP